LSDRGVKDVITGGIMCLYRGLWLGMAHFDKSGTEDFGGLAVDIEGANFGFRGGGHDVAKDAACGMYAAVVGWLRTGSFNRIKRTGT
jgi:hypothetical protein